VSEGEREGEGSRRDLARQRWRDETLIALGLAALAAVLALQGWAWRLDMVVYDLGMARFGRPPPQDIVIVAIDEASLQRIGRWPWSRAVHATLLETRLATLPRPPRAIGIDVLFSECDDIAETDRQRCDRDLSSAADQRLAQAIRQSPPVVLPVHWRHRADRGHEAVQPASPLPSVARLGAVSVRSDEDGVLRDSYLQAGVEARGQKRYPSFALAVLQAGGEDLHPRARQRVTDAGEDSDAAQPQQAGEARTQGNFAIRYAGPRETVDHVSYVDVLEGKVAPERLAGKYVLIGMTAAGLGDSVATPVNRHTMTMPGIEVHANALHTLRSGDGIQRIHPGPVAALSAAALLALLLAFARFGPRVALPLAVCSIPLAVLASVLALNAGVWFSPVPYCAAAVLAYPLWSWRRLERAVSRLDQEIAQLVQAEPLKAQVPAQLSPRARSTDGDVLEARLHALRRAGLLVRETRRFFAEALAAMPTAMLVGDRSLRVVLGNPRAAALFDIGDVEELLGLDLARLLGEFTPTAGPYDWQQALRALQPGAPPLAVEVAQEGGERATGAYVVNVAVVELQGLARLIVTISDVAPVKQAQRDREEVLAFVSHDLRSPASAIMLLADLHQQGKLQMTLPELLAEVKRLAGRTLMLAEGLVRAAQVQTQPLKRESVTLADLLDESLADLRARAQAADVQLAVAVEPGGLAVPVDRALLARAIGNLVGNALRHGPPGTQVLVTAGVHQQRLRIAVRDHGRGLSAEQIEQLARGDEGAAVGDASGVGLGLLFVQRVARRHGGLLHAGTPANGPGAWFEIDIPTGQG
jgi:CHASE2 domain-containing sensor protein/signal transduction histidine kinase